MSIQRAVNTALGVVGASAYASRVAKEKQAKQEQKQPTTNQKQKPNQNTSKDKTLPRSSEKTKQAIQRMEIQAKSKAQQNIAFDAFVNELHQVRDTLGRDLMGNMN